MNEQKEREAFKEWYASESGNTGLDVGDCLDGNGDDALSGWLARAEIAERDRLEAYNKGFAAGQKAAVDSAFGRIS